MFYRKNAIASSGVPRLTFVLLLIAAALILLQYAVNRSFWIDEAWLALNVVERSPAQLLQPLDNHMVGPAGFLLVSKGLVSIWGRHDYVLRVLPLAFALGALVVAYRLARRLGDDRLAAMFVVLVFLNPLTIYYSSEYKPYAGELFFALLGMAIWVRHRRDANALARALAALVMVAVWFTYAVYVFLPALALAAAARRFPARQLTRSTWGWVAAAALTVGGYAGYFVLGHAHAGFMQAYFVRLGQLYRPDAEFPASLLRWLVAQPRALLSVFRGLESVLVKTGLVALAGVAAALALAEHRVALRRSPWRPLLDFAVLLTLTHLAFAAAGCYPFDTRFLLYLLPLLAFHLAAVSADGLRRTSPRVQYAAVAGLVVLSVPGFLARHPAAYPFEIDNIKATLHSLERYQPRRVVAIGLVRHTLEWYAPELVVDTVSMQRALPFLRSDPPPDSTAIVFSRWGMPAGFETAFRGWLAETGRTYEFTERDNSLLFLIN